AALLLQSRIGQQFDAMVTGASAKGTYVRTMQPLAEGRLVRGFEGLDVGDALRVQLLRTDVQRGFIDFARVTAARGFTRADSHALIERKPKQLAECGRRANSTAVGPQVFVRTDRQRLVGAAKWGRAS